MRDNVNGIKFAYPKRFADYNAASVAAVAIDLNGFNAVAIGVEVGTMTGAGTFTPTLQESDDGTIWTDVDAEKIIGDAPAVLATDTNQKFGYNGSKRYIAVPVVKAGAVTAASFSITAVLSRSELEPVDA